jgi:FecR protein
MNYKIIAASLLGLGLVFAPVFAAEPARPGTVNYIEGAAYIDGQQIDQKQIGNINLSPGQELTTGAGKAEVLLTPGVFLRVDDNSAVKMVSPDLTLTQVQIEKGRAGVEVDEIHDQNNLQVIDAGVTTRLKKTGYYEFDANKPAVMVLKGKADVKLENGKDREVKGHHELALESQGGQPVAQQKPASFDPSTSTDELMNWSKLRSQYLAEANNELAPEYASGGYYPGWYPYGFGYTYIGAGPFNSPFGWGFYPLGWGWGGGWYGGWGGGWYGAPVYHGRHFEGHGRVGMAHQGFAHNGGVGFHGGAAGFHGGGGRGR